MRVQASILAIGIGCALVAVTALVADYGTVRATGEERPRGNAALPEVRDERPPAEVQLTAPRVELDRVPERATRQPTDTEENASGERAPSLSTIDEEFRHARELGVLDDVRLAEFLAQLEVERGDPKHALELLRAYGSNNSDLWWAVVEQFVQTTDPAEKRAAVLAALETFP